MELPINSDVGLAVVSAYLVIKELVSVIKVRKEKEVVVHADTDLREAINELSKLLAIQTEILRNIAENQKEIFRMFTKQTSIFAHQ